MRKKTKIVATVSDMKCDTEFIKELYSAGVDIIRLNTAHQALEDTLRVVKNIREVSDTLAIMIDTKGPEIRTTKCVKDIEFHSGDIVKVKGAPDQEHNEKEIYVNYEDFVKDVPVNSRILFDDGELEFEVESKDSEFLTCIVKNDGVLKSKRTVNIPSISLNLPALNKKDIDYISFAVEYDIDFIAHSFVRRKEDIIAIQSILDSRKSDAKIIAKIENEEGVSNIDDILKYAHGIMIARGDLAIEIPAEKIPSLQKEIIAKCISRRKPVIIATQMLHSMIERPRPTRAEISDVANAVFDKTDAIMLSGETAFGKYPIETVKTMVKIVKESEKGIDRGNQVPELADDNQITQFLAKSAVIASSRLGTEAIVIDTLTGRTARAISSYRGKPPLFAACYNMKTLRELKLSYGVFPFFEEPEKHVPFSISKVLLKLLKKNDLEENSRIVILGGSFGPGRGVSFLEIGSVKELSNLGKSL